MHFWYQNNRRSSPASQGKIAKKAVCGSVFLTISHCILSAELTKTHSFNCFLAILPTILSGSCIIKWLSFVISIRMWGGGGEEGFLNLYRKKRNISPFLYICVRLFYNLFIFFKFKDIVMVVCSSQWNIIENEDVIDIEMFILKPSLSFCYGETEESGHLVV